MGITRLALLHEYLVTFGPHKEPRAVDGGVLGTYGNVLHLNYYRFRIQIISYANIGPSLLDMSYFKKLYPFSLFYKLSGTLSVRKVGELVCISYANLSTRLLYEKGRDIATAYE